MGCPHRGQARPARIQGIYPHDNVHSCMDREFPCHTFIRKEGLDNRPQTVLDVLVSLEERTRQFIVTDDR